MSSTAHQDVGDASVLELCAHIVASSHHEGLREAFPRIGLLDTLAPSARLTRFEPKEPKKAGCMIEVDGFERSEGLSHAPSARP